MDQAIGAIAVFFGRCRVGCRHAYFLSANCAAYEHFPKISVNRPKHPVAACYSDLHRRGRVACASVAVRNTIPYKYGEHVNRDDFMLPTRDRVFVICLLLHASLTGLLRLLRISGCSAGKALTVVCASLDYRVCPDSCDAGGLSRILAVTVNPGLGRSRIPLHR